MARFPPREKRRRAAVAFSILGNCGVNREIDGEREEGKGIEFPAAQGRRRPEQRTAKGRRRAVVPLQKLGI